MKTLPDDQVSYSYDLTDNLIHIEDNDPSIDFVYDLSGRLLQTTTHCKGDTRYCQPDLTITYNYDKNGQILYNLIRFLYIIEIYDIILIIKNLRS